LQRKYFLNTLLKERQRKELMGRHRRRCKQLLDDFKGTREYRKLKDKALDHNLWRTRFGRGHGPAVRQTTERTKYLNCMDFI
jgi:hypothetical protein